MMDGKPSETCRASYRNKLRNVASCWLYSAKILAMHGPMNVKLKKKTFSLAYEFHNV